MLIDLSDIRVFEDVDAYVVLLILQKRSPMFSSADAPKAILVKCRDFAGQALQDALDGKIMEGPYYRILEIEQRHFAGADWTSALNPESEIILCDESLTEISTILEVREGFVSGADDIFIRDRSQVPKGEERVYVPYLPDREMQPYAVPRKVERVLFYPTSGASRLSEEDLREQFPRTWQYLLEHKGMLENRRSVTMSGNPWWRPVRMRSADTMLRPKIISPHLILSPRFALDEKGQYAVSHCPLLYPRIDGDEIKLLRFILAILNSSIGHWLLAQRSHKYSRGYLMLEPKILKRIKVPIPGSVPPHEMTKIQDLVQSLIIKGYDEGLQRDLDDIVVQLYKLSAADRQKLGIRTCIC
jgi:hypothetical protein